MNHMNICPYIQVGGEDEQSDLALSVEHRDGRMPVAGVKVVHLDGCPHLTWTAADGKDEAISFAEAPHLADIAANANGCVLVEFDERGLIESTAQVVRANSHESPRETCHG